MSSAVDVTVIIPAYNSEHTIERAIKSCHGLEGCAVIVVDDGSQDQTATVARDCGVEVITQKNAGASAARSTGLRTASRDFIIFLDADDELISPGVLESLSLLRRHSSACVAAGRVLGVLPNGTERRLDRAYDRVDANELVVRGFGPWPPAASVIRRQSLQSAAGLSIPSLATRYAEDYEMLIRLCLTGDVIMHDHLTTRYRLFAGKSSKAPVQAIRDKEAIRKHYALHLGISARLMTDSELRAAASMRAARSSAANGAWISAGAWVLRSVAASPALILKKVSHRLQAKKPASVKG